MRKETLQIEEIFFSVPMDGWNPYLSYSFKVKGSKLLSLRVYVEISAGRIEAVLSKKRIKILHTFDDGNYFGAEFKQLYKSKTGVSFPEEWEEKWLGEKGVFSSFVRDILKNEIDEDSAGQILEALTNNINKKEYYIPRTRKSRFIKAFLEDSAKQMMSELIDDLVSQIKEDEYCFDDGKKFVKEFLMLVKDILRRRPIEEIRVRKEKRQKR